MNHQQKKPLVLTMAAALATVGAATFPAQAMVAQQSQPADADASTSLRTVGDRIRADQLSEPLTEREWAEIELALEQLQPDGSFGDLDYESVAQPWTGVRHHERIGLMSRAWADPASPRKGDQQLLDAIKSALTWWVETLPPHFNWFPHEIHIPQELGQALIVLDGAIEGELFDKALAQVDRSQLDRTPKPTGQNLFWFAENTIYRAILHDDLELGQSAVDSIIAELRITRGEGLQPDMSFHQHGPLLTNLSYGDGTSVNMPRLAKLLTGTELAFPADKVDLMARYMLDGQRHFIYQDYGDLGARGRSIARGGSTATNIRQGASYLLELDELPRRDEVEGVANGEPFVGNKQFPFSDVMTHHRPGWYATARFFSVRTRSTDTPHGEENIRGHHLADGLNLLVRDGAEYLLIQPVWDWQMLPGTTVEQTGHYPDGMKEVGITGESTFVGGASDGSHGIAAANFKRDTLTARKSFHFYDDAYVALGSAINSTNDVPTFTTIQQALLRGTVTTPDGVIEAGEYTLAGPTWVHHDGVGYVIPEGVTAKLAIGEQTGSWHKINRSRPDQPVSHDVFKLWIDHQTRPNDASYAYIVRPGVEVDMLGDDADVQIVHNDADAAVTSNGQLVEAVMFAAGVAVELEAGTLRTDKPCTLLLNLGGTTPTLTASNPELKPMVLKVRWETSDDTWEATLELPGEDQVGSSVTVEFESVAARANSQ